MGKAAIIGAGSWGTALAVSLSNKQQPVTLWCRNAEQAADMLQDRENKKYLPEVELADNITITTDLADALSGAEFVVFAVPSQSLRETLVKCKPLLAEDAILINTAKGLEVGTNLRLSQVVEEVIPGTAERFVALYGPSHAEEVGKGMLTTIVAASVNQAAADRVQDLFMSPVFRVYTNTDMIGVEISGATKNIIALAAGIANGLGLGDNAKAGLLTRGMAEISRLGIHLGANPLTFSGLTGIGDLVVTCTSQHSRNYRCGYALGSGKKLDEILVEMGMVVEGVKTTKATVELSRELGVPMPIAEQVYSVLFEGMAVEEAVHLLMTRNKKSEEEFLS
ncbi:MAG: NAD(P)H-dependent glycerol-3-phosphate dehydrogenase [Peptococcaceae bacterium]|nr:NAD(P)H-dependent glycerol-3-phosphate dehydrogenase [Peptococcaceae bacterium]